MPGVETNYIENDFEGFQTKEIEENMRERVKRLEKEVFEAKEELSRAMKEI